MLLLFDGLLALTLVWLALRAVAARNLFRCSVSFITLGLVLAVAWVRLRAPDVALAEAAVGSGLTGAMVLASLARMSARENQERAVDRESEAP